MNIKIAIIWSMLWISLAVGWGISLFFGANADPTAGLEFFSVYITEKILSFDNLFVFYLILKAFNIDLSDKKASKILFYGMGGALMMRFLMIYSGTALIQNFSWMLYVFGALLLLCSIKLFVSDEQQSDIHPLYNYLKEKFPALSDAMMAIIIVECMDIIFAVDSIPAAFGITTHAPTIYAANIFAILGLRSLFFVVAYMIQSLVGMTHAFSLILGFIGLKMLVSSWIHIPSIISFGVIIGIMIITIIGSVTIKKLRSRL